MSNSSMESCGRDSSGSFGEAPGFNIAPLQVFKVPDTLTTTAISANYTIYLSQRPESAEVNAVRAIIEGIPTMAQQQQKQQLSPTTLAAATAAARATSIPLHFCNVSSALATGAIEAANRSTHYDLSIGTSPQYLHLSSEMLLPPSGPSLLVHPTLAKCSPPVRHRSNQVLLSEGVCSGAVRAISSYSLCFELRHKMMHTNDLIRSVGGVNSLDTLVSSNWTWCRNNNQTLVDLVHLMSTEPARLLGLEGVKGVLKVGAHADLCVFDP